MHSSGAKAVESVSAQNLMTHIENHTRKGWFFADTFLGYQSLQRLGKHLVINHSKEFVNKNQEIH